MNSTLLFDMGLQTIVNMSMENQLSRRYTILLCIYRSIILNGRILIYRVPAMVVSYYLELLT